MVCAYETKKTRQQLDVCVRACFGRHSVSNVLQQNHAAHLQLRSPTGTRLCSNNMDAGIERQDTIRGHFLHFLRFGGGGIVTHGHSKTRVTLMPLFDLLSC